MKHKIITTIFLAIFSLTHFSFAETDPQKQLCKDLGKERKAAQKLVSKNEKSVRRYERKIFSIEARIKSHDRRAEASRIYYRDRVSYYRGKRSNALLNCGLAFLGGLFGGEERNCRDLVENKYGPLVNRAKVRLEAKILTNNAKRADIIADRQENNSTLDFYRAEVARSEEALNVADARYVQAGCGTSILVPQITPAS